ncbi:MAG: OmpA family protein [Pseudomonadota bacterium]
MLRCVLTVLLAFPIAAAAQDPTQPTSEAIEGVEDPLGLSGEEGEAPAAIVNEPIGDAATSGGPDNAVTVSDEGATGVSLPEVSSAVTIETNQDGQETVVMLSDVLFAFGDATIGPDAEAVLREAADKIVGLDGVVIEGHTDDVGSDAYNVALGKARAEAVRAWLASVGLDAGAFEVVSKGESEPKIPNRTAEAGDLPENRAQNRRVVFILPPQE